MSSPPWMVLRTRPPVLRAGWWIDHLPKTCYNYNLTSFLFVRVEYTRILRFFPRYFPNRLRSDGITRSLELNKTRDID